MAKNKYITGIDPGVSGGVACVGVTSSGELVVPKYCAMPVRLADGGPKNEVDGEKLSEELECMLGKCYLEKVGAMSKQGVTSMFNFGKAYGTAIGVLDAMGFETIRVTPQTWKRKLGLSSNKDLSKALAYKLFPRYPGVWRDEGVSEAALLAYYGHVIEGNAKLETLR